MTGLPAMYLVKSNDRHQHAQATNQGVKEKLERGFLALLTTPDADQEEHRDQGDFPEEVEEHQVVGEENPHQTTFEK